MAWESAHQSVQQRALIDAGGAAALAARLPAGLEEELTSLWVLICAFFVFQVGWMAIFE